MVVVSVATCHECNGCYNKSEKESNGIPVYINERAKFIRIENDGTNWDWYIIIANEEKYKKTMDIDGPYPKYGPQGKYESLDDDSIATVNCTSVCPV